MNLPWFCQWEAEFLKWPLLSYGPEFTLYFYLFPNICRNFYEKTISWKTPPHISKNFNSREKLISCLDKFESEFHERNQQLANITWYPTFRAEDKTICDREPAPQPRDLTEAKSLVNFNIKSLQPTPLYIHEQNSETLTEGSHQIFNNSE